MRVPAQIHPAALRHATVSRWRALEQRERHFVHAAAMVLGIALVGTLTQWLVEERQQLTAQLPIARAELVRLRAAADEIADLRQHTSATTGASTGGQVTSAVDTAGRLAKQAGLVLAISANGDDSIAFSGQAEATVLLDWLATLHAEQGLAVRTLSLRTRPGPDEVSGTLIPRSPP